jgi:hypothetical protein
MILFALDPAPTFVVLQQSSAHISFDLDASLFYAQTAA